MSNINVVQSCWIFAQLSKIKSKQVAKIWGLYLKKQRFGDTMQFPEGLENTIMIKVTLISLTLSQFPETNLNEKSTNTRAYHRMSVNTSKSKDSKNWLNFNSYCMLFN